MEKTKKHIEFHVDIDEAADQLSVQIVAEQPTIGELFVCCISTVSSVASTIANDNNEDKQKVLRDISAMVSTMANKAYGKEES